MNCVLLKKQMSFVKCILTLTLSSTLLSEAYGGEPRVIDRGSNHRTWETIREVKLPGGRTRIETNSFIELQGGLHRLTEQGWAQTDPKIEVSVLDGGRGVVNNLGYRATFAPNLATPNAFDISLPDGGRVQGHLFGLAYTEGNQSALIAEVKDCVGIIGGAEQNELTFADAFTDFSVSVKYIAQRDRLSQIVIIEQQLPHPSQWGLTENAVLEVLTEFTTFPDLRKEPREPLNGVEGEHLSFASMEFVTGRAFSIGDEANSVLVHKKMELFEGQRWFLIEKMPWKAVAPELAKLPPLAKDWRKKEGPLMARNQLRLPKRDQVRAAIKPIQMAGRNSNPSGLASTVTSQKPGYLVDWELVASVNSNLWKSGVTYYIAGPISIKTNVFEPCVIKFAPTNSAKLTITGPATCLTKNYAPLVLTSRDDHTVGESIGGEALSGYAAAVALDLDYVSAGTVFDLHDIRISHAQKAINFSSGRGHVVRNLQLVKCQTGFDSSAATFTILNGLAYQLQTGASGVNNSTGIVQHLTFNQCSNLFTNLTLYATNSLLVACTNIYPFTGSSNGTNSDPSAAFQVVGAAANYLITNSPFGNAGTTNIDPTLLAALRQLTSYPPIVLATHITNPTTLSLVAQRDSDLPDLGFHYTPLDWVANQVDISSALTIQPATALAVWGDGDSYGLQIIDGGSVVSEGTVTSPCQVARYNLVQEQANSTWAASTCGRAFVTPDNGSGMTPSARFRFTHFTMPPTGGEHFHVGFYEHPPIVFVDCQFASGRLLVDSAGAMFTNCLLDTVESTFVGRVGNFQNNLFYGGSAVFAPVDVDPFYISDNLFDKTAIDWPYGSITHDYNGYVTNSTGQWLSTGGGHDVFTNAFGYQTGTLGRFYQPTNSLFVNVGSTTANLLGLYHYTVLTNNVKETNTIVDIGFHYVATDANGNPLDDDSDGTPDYLEDLNGNGTVNSGETDWQSSGDGGLRVLITRPKNGSILP
jgi:hypothetical protein